MSATNKTKTRPEWMRRQDVYGYMRSAYQADGAPYGHDDAGLAFWVSQGRYDPEATQGEPGEDGAPTSTARDPIAFFEARKRRWNPYVGQQNQKK